MRLSMDDVYEDDLARAREWFNHEQVSEETTWRDS